MQAPYCVYVRDSREATIVRPLQIQQDKETTASFRHGRTRDAMGRFPTLQRSASILGCLEMTLILRKTQDAQPECMEQTLQGLEEGTLKAERENIIQDCKSNSAEDDFKRHQAQKESLMPSSIDWEVRINWTILPDSSYHALGDLSIGKSGIANGSDLLIH
jgi:hypothetical protein